MQAERTTTLPKQRIGWVNGVLIALLVILPTVFGWFDKTAQMGILIAACAIALCFANLDKIQSFKGAGFEAQMREVVKEAHETLDRLQELARPVVRANIASVTYGGRWGGIGQDKEHELMSELIKLIKSLQMDDDPKLEAMTREFYNHYVADHIRFIQEVMRRARIQNERAAKGLEALAVRTDDYVPPPVALVWNVLDELSADEKAFLEPYVQDFEHYAKTHSFRRPVAASYDDLPDYFVVSTQATTS